MSTKLTLNVDGAVVDKAKRYAKKHNTSLSKMIENYLQSITSSSKSGEEDITPLVKSLMGIVKLPKGFDEKKYYGEYLSKKYKL